MTMPLNFIFFLLFYIYFSDLDFFKKVIALLLVFDFLLLGFLFCFCFFFSGGGVGGGVSVSFHTDALSLYYIYFLQIPGRML